MQTLNLLALLVLVAFNILGSQAGGGGGSSLRACSLSIGGVVSLQQSCPGGAACDSGETLTSTVNAQTVVVMFCPTTLGVFSIISNSLVSNYYLIILYEHDIVQQNKLDKIYRNNGMM